MHKNADMVIGSPLLRKRHADAPTTNTLDDKHFFISVFIQVTTMAWSLSDFEDGCAVTHTYRSHM